MSAADKGTYIVVSDVQIVADLDPRAASETSGRVGASTGGTGIPECEIGSEDYGTFVVVKVHTSAVNRVRHFGQTFAEDSVHGSIATVSGITLLIGGRNSPSLPPLLS